MTAEKMIATLGNTSVISVENFGDTTIEGFIASRHCSPNTAKTYRNSIRQLLKFFTANSITAPATADVDAYINSLRVEKKSDKTIRLYSTTTKLYFDYLEREGIYRNVTKAMAPLKLRKATTHNKKALTDAQAKKLLESVKGDSVIFRRDKAIIALALCTGLRTCEISRANVGDFHEDDGYWTLDVIGKGHLKAGATVKVAPVVAEMIQAYLDKRGNVADDEPLFTSTSHNTGWQKNSYGARLSEQSVGKLIRHNMIKVGIVKPAKKDKNGRVKRSPISAHSTRHYAATTAIKAGVDIREVSAMLRHTSVVVTSIYLHDISLETRRAELAVADALFCA